MGKEPPGSTDEHYLPNEDIAIIVLQDNLIDKIK